MSKLQVSKTKAVSIFILAAMFLFYEMGVQVSPSVITSQLMHDLKLSAVGLGFMSGFYFYSYTLMQIPAGLLFDRFHVRWVVIVPLCLCAAGLLFFAHAESIVGGSLGRLLMGTGSAFAFISVLVVASDLFDDKHFALLAGITQMLAAFGAMMGEGPLVPLVANNGWRHTMVLLAMVAIVLVVIIAIFVRYEKCNKFKEIEKPKKTHIFSSLEVLVKSKQTWYIAVYACVLWAPMAAFASLWGVPYFETVYGLTKSQSANLIALMWLGIALGSPVIGFLSDYMKSRRAPLVITAVLGFFGFLVINAHLAIPLWMVGVCLFAAGVACGGQALSFAVVKDNNSNFNIAAAIGFNNMAVVISGAIFQPLVGNYISDQSAVHYQQGVNIVTACYLVGAIVAFVWIRSARYK
jgi:MFS family permease